MTYREKYATAIQQMEKYLRLKEERVAALTRYYEKQRKPQYAIEFLIDRDQLVAEYARKAARYANEAAAYGVARE